MNSINELIFNSCKANGVPELAKKITWAWNDRFKTRFGDAAYESKHIRLSTKLWKRATEEQRTNVVIHEACHIIAFYKYGYDGLGHGKLWKQCMRCAGIKPSRCHKVSTKGLNRRTYKLVCDCKTHNVGKVKYNRAASGKVKYTCVSCKSTALAKES